MPRAEYVIDSDALWPRDEAHQYRVYTVDGAGVLRGPHAASDAGGLGLALVTLHEDMQETGRRLADLGTIGVLDAVAREWLIIPWQKGAGAARANP